MICFEIYRNNVKLCTAGVNDPGVLTALVTWVSYHPDSLAQWKAEGIEEAVPTELNLSVGGLTDSSGEDLTWLRDKLSVGDEIRIRIVEIASADEPRVRCRQREG